MAEIDGEVVGPAAHTFEWSDWRNGEIWWIQSVYVHPHFRSKGAIGTELNRRGVDTGLPLWSANALTTDAGLNVLRQVHLDYLNAGAEIITTNHLVVPLRRLVRMWIGPNPSPDEAPT